MTGLHSLLGDASMSVQAVGIVVGAVRWKRLSHTQRTLLALISITLANQLIATVVGRYTGNNLPFFHAYIIIEFAFLWAIFKSRIAPVFSNAVMLGIAATFALYFVLSLLFFQGPLEYPSYSRFGESLCIVAFCGAFYVNSLQKLDELMLERTFMFWLVSGLALYFISNLLINLFAHIVVAEAAQDVWNAIMIFRNILNILLYLVLGWCFFLEDSPASQNNASSSHSR